jgi:Fungal specific transcription factor domain/Fungal Zn(2)-Cys(6) binuclear cluster domain
MASPNSQQCHICQLPLARSTPSRHNQNECPFCGRTFRRVDGAKRHTRTCPSRGNRLLPPDAKRGRKLHACDACSRVKVSCDSKTPCTRCASRGLSCTYGRLCSDPTHRARKAPALPFLLACTDPSVGPVDEVILTGEPEHDPDQPAAWETSGNHDPISDTIDPRLLFLSFIGPSFSMDLDCDGMDDEHLDLGNSDEELRTRVSLLEADLQQVAVAEPHVQNFATFFTVSNFRECIKVFFQREHLLATLIYRPTFHPDQVDPTLLLAIAIAGSTYLHYRQGSTGSASFALALRGIAEKYIFRRVEQLLGSTVPSQRTLELCQAAYIIETLQSCVKDAKIRQRLITKCHPMLVELLRSLDMIGSRHESPEDWDMFVYKESCIRLVHWVFINDAWFTLFSNHPPAMTFFDMSSHLPCGDELWNVDSTSFDNLRLQQDFNSTSPCLKALISGLLGDEWTESTVALYKRLDVNHFLVLIFGEFPACTTT